MKALPPFPLLYSRFFHYYVKLHSRLYLDHSTCQTEQPDEYGMVGDVESTLRWVYKHTQQRKT